MAPLFLSKIARVLKVSTVLVLVLICTQLLAADHLLDPPNNEVGANFEVLKQSYVENGFTHQFFEVLNNVMKDVDASSFDYYVNALEGLLSEANFKILKSSVLKAEILLYQLSIDVSNPDRNALKLKKDGFTAYINNQDPSTFEKGKIIDYICYYTENPPVLLTGYQEVGFWHNTAGEDIRRVQKGFDNLNKLQSALSDSEECKRNISFELVKYLNLKDELSQLISTTAIEQLCYSKEKDYYMSAQMYFDLKHYKNIGCYLDLNAADYIESLPDMNDYDTAGTNLHRDKRVQKQSKDILTNTMDLSGKKILQIKDRYFVVIPGFNEAFHNQCNLNIVKDIEWGILSTHLQKEAKSVGRRFNFIRKGPDCSYNKTFIELSRAQAKGISTKTQD